ncbi:hypothetical protein M407DRAFT_243690 [Tulasnella calospora MUT 4182]|uniref:Uncharacterized protein n=1 Tax=Tulasnella calospora MUT 4182 TaxID=1051891 RepID=A0A0C3QIE1_9AGAM|nr:hypothetical protein M407DRAFT_243690 [Tulasnella calospora MUT 4182]
MNAESNTVTKRKVASGQEPKPAEEEDQIPNAPMTETHRGRGEPGRPVIIVPPPSAQREDNEKLKDEAASSST